MKKFTVKKFISLVDEKYGAKKMKKVREMAKTGKMRFGKDDSYWTDDPKRDGEG